MKTPELLPLPDAGALEEHMALMARVKAEIARVTGIEAATLGYRPQLPTGNLILRQMRGADFQLDNVGLMMAMVLAARNGPPPTPMYPNWDDPVC